MQKLIVALALSGAAAFVAPSAQRASLRVNAEEETAAPEPAAAPAPAAPAKKAGTSNRKDTITPSKSAGGLDLAGLQQCTIQISRPGALDSLVDFRIGLQALAYEQNPIVGYFDPLELSLKEFFDESNTATIGFLRQAELKHGRVAMAGFVGYLVHAQGITWPFKMTLDGDAWPTLGEGGVPALWDQIPEGAKWQIITAIGCLEWYDEWQYDNPAAQMPAMADKPKHYMRGGQPGAYPCGIQADTQSWSEAPEIRFPHRRLPALRGPPAQPLRPLQPLQEGVGGEEGARPQRRGEQRPPRHDWTFQPVG